METATIGWPTNVNRIILSETTISVGKDAIVNETLKSGRKRSELAGSFCPDVFSVTMDFEADTPKADLDKTEYQLFTEWYKYRCKYGSVPFEFPEIVYSPQSGFYPEPLGRTNIYKITSAVECGKSGTCQRIRMTWESVYSGGIQVITEGATVGENCITGLTKDYLEITFTSMGTNAPTLQNFTVYKTPDGGTQSAVTVKSLAYDNAYTVRLYFQTPLTAGSYTVTFATNYTNPVVIKDTYSRTITVE